MARTVLITGTSSGLGISLAIQSAQTGDKVYATMRNVKKRETLDSAAKEAGVSLVVLPLDVQKTETIQAVVEQIIADEGHIDVLINNAGAGFVRSTEQASEEDVQWIMDVNFMGVMRCTKAVMPYMRKARAGHIINITSVGGLVGQPFNEIYCAAKFAVEGYTESMASYITPNFNINFTAVEPGGIRTEFAPSVLKHVQQSGGMLDDEYLPILQNYIGGSQSRQSGEDIYQTSGEVAKVVIDCMNNTSPPIRVRSSKWAEGLTQFKTGLDPDGKKQQADVFKRFLS